MGGGHLLLEGAMRANLILFSITLVLFSATTFNNATSAKVSDTFYCETTASIVLFDDGKSADFLPTREAEGHPLVFLIEQHETKLILRYAKYFDQYEIISNDQETDVRAVNESKGSYLAIWRQGEERINYNLTFSFPTNTITERGFCKTFTQ